MALKLKQPGTNPLGQFDGLDTQVNTVKGGEVGTIVGVALAGSDRAAADANGSDGYVGTQRPVVTTTLTSGTRPLGLIDDGITGYGTMFGSVIGGTGGQLTSGAPLGPSTAYGSGKLTLWTKPGTYGVTLDAVDTDAQDGLVPTNSGLSIGDPLYATAAGLLTPDSSSAFENVVIAVFLNFETSGSLVTTPLSLVSAANSPVGVGQPQVGAFTEAIIEFAPPIS